MAKPSPPPRVDDGPRLRKALDLYRVGEAPLPEGLCARMAARLGCPLALVTHAARGHRVTLTAPAREELGVLLCQADRGYTPLLPAPVHNEPKRARALANLTLSEGSRTLLDQAESRPEVDHYTSRKKVGGRRSGAADWLIKEGARAVGLVEVANTDPVDVRKLAQQIEDRLSALREAIEANSCVRLWDQAVEIKNLAGTIADFAAGNTA